MQQEYLMDTNAFFNLLKAMNPGSDGQDAMPKAIKELLSKKLTVSSITKVEIISVLGKYARGNQGGFQMCNCVISQDGQLCQNSRYSKPRKKWNSRKTKVWLRFIDEILGDNLNYLMLRQSLLIRILFQRLKRL